MNEFTLFYALNIIKRHLLVTVAIFFVSFMVLPSLNILEITYSAQKIIKPGKHHKNFFTPLLDYSNINGVLISPSFSNYLSKNIQEGVSSFKISENEAGNMFITFKSNNHDSIINTAIALMRGLQEFDNTSIQKKLNEIDKLLDMDRQVLEILEDSNNDYVFTDQDIEYWSKKQKDYDLVIQDTDDFDQKYKINLVDLMKFKIDDTTRQVKLNRDILYQKKKINDLELIRNEGFEAVSYLFPVTKNDISQSFPNSITFFGISLLIAFFYNFILLIYKYRESVK